MTTETETDFIATLRQWIASARLSPFSCITLTLSELTKIEKRLTEQSAAAKEMCRVCGGGGFVAQKQFLDDGYGEVESCPACSSSETR